MIEDRCTVSTAITDCPATIEDRPHAMHDLIGPQSNPVEEVDEAIAVRPEEGQWPGSRGKVAGQTPAFLRTGLGETGCKAYKPARAPARQIGSDLRDFTGRCRDKRRVG